MNRQQRRQVRRQEQGADPGDGSGAPEDPASGVVLPLVEDKFPAEVEEDAAGSDLRDSRVRGLGSEAPGPRQHTGPRQFLHEVNIEMRKVAWPTRAETLNYSTVVFVTLAILMALIFVLDLGFTHVAGFLFNP